MSEERNVAFVVEVPGICTTDLDDLREFIGDFDGDESEWLLNCLGEPSVVRMALEASGEKDSSVCEVYGNIVHARLIEPGYLTDQDLRERVARWEFPEQAPTEKQAAKAREQRAQEVARAEA